LAAAVGVRLVMEQPLRTLITNIRGSENVLEAAHRYRRKVLVASTSEIYGKNDADLLSEDADRILGSPSMNRWVYSTSKAVDEYLAIAYWKEKCVPTIVTRFFNTVGPRQSPSYGMVLPRLIDQALAGEPLTVYGDGTQTRCFGFVGDVTRAVVALLDESAAVGEVFNVGSSEEVTINELAERVIRATGSKSEIVHLPYDQVFASGFEDMRRRVPDTAKIRALLDWRPEVSLDQVITSMIEHAQRRGTGGVRSALDWQGRRWGEVISAGT
jgi:UDP-glucose 4-epimerase